MVSWQEPSPLKGSKHSLQHYPHDAVLVDVTLAIVLVALSIH